MKMGINSITRLDSGGIIPLYKCPAACRHCMYGCSNERNSDYITKQQADVLCESLVDLGVFSMHIGGGEPFLNFDKLCDLISSMNTYNITVDYIETNAAWISDNLSDGKICGMLNKIKDIGGNCLLISIDPYHIEFIPLYKPIRLANLCNKVGLDYFIWKQSYIAPLSKLDVKKKYSRDELQKVLGKDYIHKTAVSYGLGYNGRALNIAREYNQQIPLATILKSAPCRELSGVSHYHADLNGKFIAPRCTGIAVDIEDLKNIKEDKYFIFLTLRNNGINSLYNYAVNKNFKAKQSYVNKCELCYEIRKFLLSIENHYDIYPEDFYQSDF